MSKPLKQSGLPHPLVVVFLCLASGHNTQSRNAGRARNTIPARGITPAVFARFSNLPTP
nr:MAG TPA: hypothetical protein [Caudoviricetes sp.]